MGRCAKDDSVDPGGADLPGIFQKLGERCCHSALGSFVSDSPEYWRSTAKSMCRAVHECAACELYLGR